jgi:hypothetical protein
MRPMAGRELIEPPSGIVVERLALTMAAAVGLAWAALDHDARTQYRIMASAALLRLGVDALEDGAVYIRASVERAAEALRQAANLAEHNKEREDLIQRLHRDASNMETLAMILDGSEPEASALPAPGSGPEDSI